MKWGEPWAEEDDDVLKRLWRAKTPRPTIARKLNRSLDGITKRARRLGLERRTSQPKPEINKDPAMRYAFAPRDDEYVALVMALGGFSGRHLPPSRDAQFFDGQRMRRAYG